MQASIYLTGAAGALATLQCAGVQRGKLRGKTKDEKSRAFHLSRLRRICSRPHTTVFEASTSILLVRYKQVRGRWLV